MAINNLLSIGNHALLANQVAISVTGNNMANVNTVGYSKQTAQFTAFMPYNTDPGQMGMGAEVSEITRSFDRLLENTYLSRFTDQGKYTTQMDLLKSVENLFNEANREGISSSMSEFFNQWQALSNFPDDSPTKQALITQADALAGIIRDTQTTLDAYQEEINNYIQNDVATANQIIQQIAELNKDIAASTLPGNNPNYLLDQRDQLVRELSEIVDVTVEDNGGIDFAVRMKSGQPLVEGETTYSLELQSHQIDYNVQGFTGEANVSGEDAFEYTLEFDGANSFRVSLDGGKTWLKDAEGNVEQYTVPAVGDTVKVKDLEISFTADDFAAGDKMTITPKMGLYWDSPTRPPENVTPLISSDGSDDGTRATGGSLSGYFITRDYNIGKYMDKMDALASTLAWEVNRIHSQSASTTPQSAFYGTEEVKDYNLPLGDSGSGVFNSDKLQEGNLTINIYDSATGDRINYGPLDFDNGTAGTQNFDPSKHSLNDLVNAINNTYSPDVRAEVINGKLEVTSREGTNLAFGQDTTGVLAALGVNTFFQGDSATTLAVNDYLRSNPSAVNAGQVNEAGVINAGDNTIALDIAKLANQTVQIHTAWESTSQTLTSYYSGVVSLVGAESANAQFNTEYQTAMSSDIGNRIQAITGVSLDEEMTNLVKFQHSYTAAAKLITTADEMLQTVLGLKQ